MFFFALRCVHERNSSFQHSFVLKIAPLRLALPSVSSRFSLSRAPPRLPMSSPALQRALTWAELSARVPPLTASAERALYTGDAFSASSYLRLFGAPEDAAQVTLFRDVFAWCPYCQKVALFLELKKIPYRVRKVTMFCYGQKEAWFTAVVPSGMLPALQLRPGGDVITESDDILAALEASHGPLGAPLASAAVLPLRALERRLFRAWCGWLCYENSPRDEAAAAAAFGSAAAAVAAALRATPGPFFLGGAAPSVADVVFVPYVERMRASLFYYKGVDLLALCAPLRDWFAALESLPAYAGFASDFHTHAHDLPPQMGGCFFGGDAAAAAAAARAVDRGPWAAVPEVLLPPPPGARGEAVRRCAKHAATLAAVNADTAPGRFDAALRTALTALALGVGAADVAPPPPGSALGLRHLRDQICAPRDMTVHAARALRQALEDAAALDSDAQPPPLPVCHRRDQSAEPFRRAAAAALKA